MRSFAYGERIIVFMLQHVFLLRYQSVPFRLTSAEKVNQWVSNATNGHIPNFLSDIPHDVLLMLMNAMYFKGETFLLRTD